MSGTSLLPPYKDIEGFLVGHCGMTPVRAACTGMEEYLQRREAYLEDVRREWEIARWRAWHDEMISPNIKPVNKPKTPRDMCPFEWEKDEVRKKTRVTRRRAKVTEEEKAALARIWEDMLARQNNKQIS